jgi:hypothetical protein
MRYAVVIEKADGNYSAYVPDLPGCVATGDSVKAVGNPRGDPLPHRRPQGGWAAVPAPMSIANYVEA